ncbi:MAG TPA: hypothetical protein DCR93_28120 [Cytophagales bacterium]|nr:hypothetical protein [Cytophagales bacterium]HAP63203.1 hypothetical protein [Cytophagales bacterium]
METKYTMELFKRIILEDIRDYAKSKPMLEPISENYLHHPLVYEASLISKEGAEPQWEIWSNKCYGYWVYAHLYKSGYNGIPIAQSVLGFREFSE